MIVRSLDQNNDWLFGKGLNDYKSANDAVAQDIQTRLNSFLGDCFFDQGTGINWLGLVGGKNEIALNLAISAVILNTQNVIKMNQLTLNLTSDRIFSVSYNVTTSYSTIGVGGTVQISI